MASPERAELEELLRRAAAGDKDAAGKAVVAYDDRLRRVVRHRLDVRVARRIDVEDVLQEVHVEALARLPEFLAKRDVPLLIWLRFLAVQRCITLARRHLEAAARDVRRDLALDAPAGDATAMALEQALEASMTTPSRAALKDEIRTGIREAVESLVPLDREILCLRHFEELDNTEAAAVLGIPAPTASKRYVRALVRLKDALDSAGLGASAAGIL
jgi:RNA polymerase sigma-70 factor (ECF subfamily)